MAMHAVGYALNDVLTLLESEGVFAQLGSERTRRLLVRIVEAARRYDSISGEILEDIGDRLGVCSYCVKGADGVQGGLCPDCRAEFERCEANRKMAPPS